jgi:hypothetical protein
MESKQWPGITSSGKKKEYMLTMPPNPKVSHATHIILESNKAFPCFQKCLTVQQQLSYCIFSSVRNKSQWYKRKKKKKEEGQAK